MALALASAVALGAGACGKPAQPAAPPPPEVSIYTVQPRTIPAHYEFVGQAAASKHVEVRAQVSGVIVSRPYREGTDVARGTVLFRIDPATYEAAYRSAQAQLATARAALGNAQRNLARLRPLLADHAVAQKDVDDAETAEEEARAAVQNAEATADRARKDLDRTDVRAEIAGRAGRALMELGALVSGPSDLLTTVDQIDPIYVDFSPSDQELLRWRRDAASKRLRFPTGALDVRALLSDGSMLRETGKVNFVDLSLQPITGTLQLRAEFPNPAHALLPGQFVRVRLEGIERTDALLVPQRAVQQGLAGAYVYVLGDSGTVATRSVSASDWQGGWWIVDSGLSAGDRVIVDGVQKVAPGARVRASTYQPSADTTLSTRMDSVPLAPGASPILGGRR
ncbi:MAG TPA: efflux RND transporter periplasmic adaptor subunit [Gemmatimonadaceae bacterium]|nr:efflux RND transporter periplasmic adaptor subunit [Gemmatimonadaceae bacterium]